MRTRVKTSLTANRRRRVVENDEYAAFLRRVLRAHGRRVGAGDVEALADLVDLSEHIDRPSATPSSGCAASATPGRRSPAGSASPARPPSSGGEEAATMPLINHVRGDQVPDSMLNVRTPVVKIPLWLVVTWWCLKGLARLA